MYNFKECFKSLFGWLSLNYTFSAWKRCLFTMYFSARTQFWERAATRNDDWACETNRRIYLPKITLLPMLSIAVTSSFYKMQVEKKRGLRSKKSLPKNQLLRQLWGMWMQYWKTSGLKMFRLGWTRRRDSITCHIKDDVHVIGFFFLNYSYIL